ncbi:MAG: hypothetical protein KQJ78_07305 [Deltaproteobacteria bacterium]|nr:hypothetical protein [Deltaproteobacteria bacterium]
MAGNSSGVFVEIVAKKKGCMLCDLAEAILEAAQENLPPDSLAWTVVDAGSREGLLRVEELAALCGTRPPVPSIVINQTLAFDHIPDMEALTTAVEEALAGDAPPEA